MSLPMNNQKMRSEKVPHAVSLINIQADVLADDTPSVCLRVPFQSVKRQQTAT